ncbi:hypothetical protein [Methylopila sp. 73B]|uniref:hypothetical protein n=1 Tax=Methylopila sp. 73B TaxID=1120792 RepID=UPI0003AA728F|nr:hypothetical protein [Methylopila sp. 73B]
MAITASRFPGVAGVTPRASYEPGDSVDPRDGVYHDGRYWYAKRATSAVPSPSSDDWEMLFDLTPNAAAQEGAEAARAAAEAAALAAAQDRGAVADDKEAVASERSTVMTARAEVIADREEVAANAGQVTTLAQAAVLAAEATGTDRAAVAADKTAVATDRAAVALGAANADAAATRAETASSIAIAASDVYKTVAEGEAATTTGELFYVIAADSNEFTELRERTSGGSTVRKRQPSSEKIVTLETRITAAGTGAQQVEGAAYLDSLEDEFDNVAFGIRDAAGGFEIESPTITRLDTQDEVLATTLTAAQAATAALATTVNDLETRIPETIESSSFLDTLEDEHDNVVFGVKDAAGNFEIESPTIHRLDAKDAALQAAIDAMPQSGIPTVEGAAYLDSVEDEYGNVVWGLREDNFEEESVTQRRQDAKLLDLQAQIDDIEVGGGGASRTYVPLRPPAAYGRLPGPVRLHMSGIIVDAELDLVWSIPRADPKLAIVYPVASTDPTPITAQYGYWDPADGALKSLGSFPIYWAPTVANLVEPAVTQWFIATGDSTMDAQAGVLTPGSWWNEASRQLTGVGATLTVTDQDTGAVIPARPAGSLTKIKFFGTLGTGPVKHEGRPGWSMFEYNNKLTTGSGVNLKTNPYYDATRPAGRRMNPAKYCRDNNLMADGSLNANGVAMPDGVLSNFSNLNIVFAVGWNNVYGPTPDPAQNAIEARSDMEVALDSCHETAPGAKCIVFGIGAPPKTIFKNQSFGEDFVGDGVAAGRFVSQRTVFEQATKAIGLAYQAACAPRSYATFVQTSHQICPETAYSKTKNKFSDWSSRELEGSSDHVHYAPIGYMEWADLTRNYIAYTYCRGA